MSLLPGWAVSAVDMSPVFALTRVRGQAFSPPALGARFEYLLCDLKGEAACCEAWAGWKEIGFIDACCIFFLIPFNSIPSGIAFKYVIFVAEGKQTKMFKLICITLPKNPPVGSLSLPSGEKGSD